VHRFVLLRAFRKRMADDATGTTEFQAGLTPDLTPSPLRGSILRLLADPEAAAQDERLYDFLGITAFKDGLTLWFGPAFIANKSMHALKLLIDRDIAELDSAINAMANAIIHHERFQKLECLWRSIDWLLDDLPTDDSVEVRVIDMRWSEIIRDMDRAPEFDQSELFNKIYNEEFGTPGGIPYSLLIGDYLVRHRPSPEYPTDDVAGLRNFAKISAAAFAPFIIGVSPTLFGVNHYSELDLRQSIATTLKQVEYTRWRSLQEISDARFIGLVAPRFLMRKSHRGRSVADPGFIFKELVGRQDNTDRLWANGAFAFAQVAIRAFIDYRWLAATRGTPQDMIAGGVISNLPLEDFETESNNTAIKFSPEVALSEALDHDMNEHGFICLRPCKDTSFAAFYNLPSLHRAKTNYNSSIARANEQLSAMINYILCVARFAHYIKVIGRDWVGSYKTASECENLLNKWLMNFCSASGDSSFEMKAKYPLQEGRVTVSDIPSQPGHYSCTIALKPHFQLDQVVSEFQLVTSLDNVKRAA
jgi:type VI secretion system protein ImpD